MSEYKFKTDKEIKTCNECPMSENIEIEHCWYCKLLQDIAENNTKISDCPLKELPTHGRLIDADKILEKDVIWTPIGSVVYPFSIDSAPIVIEASKERENDRFSKIHG